MNEGAKAGIPDEELIRSTLGGDEEAFRELMERYKGRAFGVAVGIVGDGDDALDVVQDSFIKAYYKLKEFRFGSSFYTWFYRLLVNQAIDRWRKSARSAWSTPKATCDASSPGSATWGRTTPPSSLSIQPPLREAVRGPHLRRGDGAATAGGGAHPGGRGRGVTDKPQRGIPCQIPRVACPPRGVGRGRHSRHMDAARTFQQRLAACRSRCSV